VNTTGQQLDFGECKRYPDAENVSEAIFSKLLDLNAKNTSNGNLAGIEECTETMAILNFYNSDIISGLIMSGKGVQEYYSNKNTTSLGYYLQALEIFDRTGYTEGLANLLNNIAIIFARVDDYEMTLKYLYRAFESTEVENSASRSLILLNIAEIEILLGNYEKSLDISNQLFENYNKNEVEFDIIAIIGIIVRNYNKLEEYDTALNWINKVSDSMVDGAGVVDLNSYCANAMETYFQLQQYEKVLSLASQIYPPKVEDFLPDLYEAIDILSTISKNQNQFEKAKEYEEILCEIEFSQSSINREELVELLMIDYAFNHENIEKTKLEQELYLNSIKHAASTKFIVVFIIVITLALTTTLILLRIRKLRHNLKEKLIEENSKLAEINRQLGSSNRFLEKENSLLDTLISIFAHDLINPFQAILGFSRLMVSDFDNIEEESIREYTGMLSDTSFQLNQLLTNLQNMAVLQDKSQHLESSQFAISPVISDIISLFNPAARKKSITIEFKSKDDIYCFFNPDILQSVIRNILSNAVKFSNKNGKIIIESSTNNGLTSISIEDFGVGISQEKIEKLLSREYLMSSPGTLQEKGSGLGLSISIELLELYNGLIYIESTEGEGTLITVTIPESNA
jgi:signal transduction histidine kinase